ncbi:acyltransferase family protein, partial [Veillonella caviae]
MRIEWLDSLKGFAIFLVVVGHVVLGYIRADIFPQYYNELQYIYNIIYSFHMPLFFLISGFLYKLTWSKKNTGVFKKIGNKFLNMVPMYLVFSLTFWVFKYYATLYSN